MSGVQVNEGIFAGVESLAGDQMQQAIRQVFAFTRRRVLLGPGAVALLGPECRGLGVSRALLVHDPGVPRLADRVEQALEAGGVRVVGRFDRVVSNPTVESVAACAAAVAKADCEGVVAVGGGSTLDAAKAAACTATVGQPIDAFYGFDLIPQPARWPLVAVPTTAGTGSEASRICVVADATGKKAVYSDYLIPSLAVVDPELHANMPPPLTAVTGLDALAHALECTASKKSTPLADAVAREALRHGCPALAPAIVRGSADPGARQAMARCSLLAGLLLGPVNTGAAHALGYGIEKVSGARGLPVPHGAAVALALPGVVAHNLPGAADKYYYAAGAAGLDLAGASREDGVRALARWIDRVRRAHTPWGTLEQAGLGEADIAPMVDVAMQVRRLLDPNPVEVTAQDAEGIYRQVLR
ncbi:MAG: iron-containing alcohol dehydrogenase [Candidatus Latescibacterota bacterium]